MSFDEEKYLSTLTIDLVPSTCWFSNVRSEVKKRQWDKIRKRVYEKAFNVCEICGGKGVKHPVECHEIFDYDDVNGIQKLVRMVALCPSCHHVKHFGLWEMKGQRDKLYKHLCKVNGWDKTQAVRHRRESFRIWEERSRKEWDLDLTHLKEEYGIDIYEK